MRPDDWGRCAVWGCEAKTDVSDNLMLIESPRAGGAYEVTDLVRARLNGVCSDRQAQLALTEFIWRENQFGSVPRITTSNIDGMLSTPRPSVSERLDRLLLFIERRTGRPGEEVAIAQDDRDLLATISAAENDGEEVWYLTGALNELGFVRMDGIMGPQDSAVLRPSGFARIAELKHNIASSDQAFVAMWFSPTMESAYVEGIEPAISAVGYRALRIDRKEHNNKIDDEIVSEIRRSRFIVADFTSEPEKPRGGVYFEAGLAMGLGKPVIWTCREDCLKDVHFDTRQYSHIAWTSPEGLRTALAKRISAVIGDGPGRAAQ